MSDWEVVRDNDNQPSQSSSDWEVVPSTPSSMKPQPEESTGMSVLKAIPRVGEDIYKGVAGAIKAAPEYWNKAQTEVPGVFNAIRNNPASAGKQALAGVAEMGQKVFNSPHDVINYLSQRLNLFPKDLNQKIQMGRMPESTPEINAMLGTPQQPGEALIRGIGRNAINIVGAKGLATNLNPMQLTDKRIIKNVLSTEKQMKEKYSGTKGLYNQLSEEAKDRGINQANINKRKIDLNTIKKYSSEKSYASLDNFLADKNLTNAQKAISDLGFTERRLENKLTLNSEEQSQLKAVKNAKNYIQENMFKDKKGKVHTDLLDKHKAIQKGYATEVIPYTKNKAIQAYKKGEKLPNELVSSLSRGKFAAQRGEFHQPPMALRAVKSLLTNPLSREALKGLAIGSGVYGGYEGLKSAFGGGSHD